MIARRQLCVPLCLAILSGIGLSQKSPQSKLHSVQGVAITPQSLHFPNTRLGEVSTPRTLNLVNHSGSTVSTSIVSGSGSFEIGGGCETLTAHEHCALSVSYRPAHLGEEHGKISISTDGSITTIAVEGRGDVAGLTSLSVSPKEAVVQVSEVTRLSATGTYRDGTTRDLTPFVHWTSSDVNIAAVDASGAVSGVHIGSVRVKASLASRSDSGLISVPGFDSTGSLNFPRESHTVSTLVDRRILVMGGWNAFANPGSPKDTNPASTELYDPRSGAFSPGPMMSMARPFNPKSVTLPNGWVLVVGGKFPCVTGANNPEVFDPRTSTFTRISAPAFSLNYAAAVLQHDGGAAILIGGQADCPASPPTSTRIDRFNPATAQFTHITDIPFLFQTGNPRSAVLLHDGRIWIFDGVQNGIFNPASGTFSRLPDRPFAISDAQVLNGGKVLALSVLDGDVNHAEIMDPSTGLWTPVTDPPDARTIGRLMLMQNGRVFWHGGVSPLNGFIATSDEFDPVSNTFVSTNIGTLARAVFAISLLDNGEVITIGGRGDDITLSRADLYQSELLTPTGLVSISVWHGAATFHTNLQRRLVAVGEFTDGHHEVLKAVAWDVDGCPSATITADGYFWARSSGTCTVTASAGSVTGKNVFSVH